MSYSLPKTDMGKRKVSKIMSEYKQGSLKSSAGQKIANQKQAIAVALSEGRKSEKKRLK